MTLKTFKEFILENKNYNTMYHFTRLDGFKKLVQSNFMFKSPNGYMSLTRAFNFPLLDNMFNIEYYNIRLNINANKLSFKYKIIPINGLEDNDENIFGTDKNSDRVEHKSEMEEVVKLKGITNIKPYIISIDVIDTEKNREGFKELENKLKDININFVKSFKPIK